MALSKNYTFTANTVATAAEVNSDFDQLFAAIGTMAYTGTGKWFTDDEAVTTSLQKVSTRFKSWVNTSAGSIHYAKFRQTSAVPTSAVGFSILRHDGTDFYIGATKLATEDYADSAGGGGQNILVGSALTFATNGASVGTASGATADATLCTFLSDADMAWTSGYAGLSDAGLHGVAAITNNPGNAGVFGWLDGHNGWNNAVSYDLIGLQGETVGLGVEMICGTADVWRLVINDGVTTEYSAYHSGSGDPEKLTITSYTIDAAATLLNVSIQSAAGAAVTCYVTRFYCGPGLTRWVPHVSRGRVWEYTVAYSSAGAKSITGCPFSPIAVSVNYVLTTTGPGSFGTAAQVGASIVQGASSVSGAATAIACYINGANYSTVNSFDADGCTHTVVYSGAGAHNSHWRFDEGNPI
jgi:hypothetical protein